jgi:Fic family protein
MEPMRPLHELDPRRFETTVILRAVATASRQLAELKGVAASIPNQRILINTLGLQEAKDSSAIENIVTTHDELFRNATSPDDIPGAAREVARYREALSAGFRAVTKRHLLTTRHILDVQAEIEPLRPGFRTLPGTALRTDDGRLVYTPPPPNEVAGLMSDLDRFINDDRGFDADPLVKMALVHHQFESIHPFYDGNGRTGRIICVLYLVKARLLDIPVLYLSRHIVRTKSDYYRLLQDVRDHDAWEDWALYMLAAVERTAAEGVATVGAIRRALLDVKHAVRRDFKFYSQDLINNLFMHPYTKIEFVQRDLRVGRLTAARYLDALTRAGIVDKRKIGRSNYYINTRLYGILTGDTMTEGEAR